MAKKLTKKEMTDIYLKWIGADESTESPTYRVLIPITGKEVRKSVEFNNTTEERIELRVSE